MASHPITQGSGPAKTQVDHCLERGSQRKHSLQRVLIPPLSINPPFLESPHLFEKSLYIYVGR